MAARTIRLVHRYVAPSRPLPPACRWLLQEGSAHLLWNGGCIAMVYVDPRSTCCHWIRA
jgi:hypothetical protein